MEHFQAQYAITCSTILSLLSSVSSMFLSKYYLLYITCITLNRGNQEPTNCKMFRFFWGGRWRGGGGGLYLTVPSPATEPSVPQSYSAAANQTSTCQLVVVGTIQIPFSDKARLKTFSVLVTCINAYQSCVKHLGRLISCHGLASPPPPHPGGFSGSARENPSLFHGLQKKNHLLYFCFVNLRKR